MAMLHYTRCDEEEERGPSGECQIEDCLCVCYETYSKDAQ